MKKEVKKQAEVKKQVEVKTFVPQRVKEYKLTLPLVQGLINYLEAKPYNETVFLIQDLHQQLAKQDKILYQNTPEGDQK